MPKIFPLRALVAAVLIAPFAVATPASAQTTAAGILSIGEQTHASRGRPARTGEQRAHVRPQRPFQPQGDMT
jgi:hypothetical protein